MASERTVSLRERVRRLEQRLEQQQLLQPAHRPSMKGINKFCEDHDLSRAFFYKLRIPYIKIGARSFVLREVEDQWMASLRDSNRQTAFKTSFAQSRDHGSKR